MRRPWVACRLFFRVGLDVIVSNWRVLRGTLARGDRLPRGGFVTVPLDLRDPNGLAVLAAIMCVIPGTIWSELALDRSALLVHLFEIDNAQAEIRDHQVPLRAAPAGDIRMSEMLFAAIVFTLGCYVLSMALCLLRLVRGPSAQDRVLAMDLICTVAMLVLMVLAIRYRSVMYFEAALLIALFGFISSAAMAKFLLRGEVIE